MESPVVIDQRSDYHNNQQNEDDKGFPFDEEDSDDWSDLARTRARLRPGTWGRKRRSPNHTADAYDDFTGSLGDQFNRFPFDNIPAEFREHFPGHWGERYVPQERTAHTTHQEAPQGQPHTQPQQQTAATQTEHPDAEPAGEPVAAKANLPQYGLRNTVPLGQKTPLEPGLVDAEGDRNQRSMSAPPDSRVPPGHQNMGNSAGGYHQSHAEPRHDDGSHSNVRHIPIFVEGRDEPIINKNVDSTANFAESKPSFQPPPPEKEQFFAEREVPMGFTHPPNFSRAFGTPFSKGFRQTPQPFTQQKVFPQTNYTQQAAPPQQGRAQSPKPAPVHHPQQRQEHTAPPPQQNQQQNQQRAPSPPKPQPPPSSNDPISKILSIQKDVLDLMTKVETFKGTKKNKEYIYLDEMLTRNLIKLDDIETEGKENIRLARKEAIRCIQKCIAVLEAKADGGQSKPAEDGESGEITENETNGQHTNEQNNEEMITNEAPTKEANSEGDKTAEVNNPHTTPAPAADAENKEEQSPAKKKLVKKSGKKREKSKDRVEPKKDGEANENSEANSMQVEEKVEERTEEAQTPMEVENATPSQ